VASLLPFTHLVPAQQQEAGRFSFGCTLEEQGVCVKSTDTVYRYRHLPSLPIYLQLHRRPRVSVFVFVVK
jgi:hypothetical protein